MIIQWYGKQTIGKREDKMTHEFSFEGSARKTVLLSGLVIDWKRHQLRAVLNEGNVERLRQRYQMGADVDPIDVAEITGASGTTWFLINGFHRRRALMLLGRDEVEANVKAFRRIEEAMIAGFHRNNNKTVGYSRDEWLSGFRLYIEAGMN